MAIKKYSKVKFTLRKELVFILVAIVGLLVATILLNRPTKEEKVNEYWTLTEGHPFEVIELEDLASELSNKKEGEYTFVYFGTPEDAETASYLQTVMSIAELVDVTHIYLVDSEFVVGKDRENDKEFDDELLALEGLFEYKEKDEDGETQTIKLDSVNNFWLFDGNKVLKSATDYKASGATDWARALIQMFTFAKA